jgi:hypothetical protein
MQTDAVLTLAESKFLSRLAAVKKQISLAHGSVSMAFVAS